MATVIQSLGSLADYSPAWTASASYGSLRMYDQYNYAYATLYRTQPNVRTCVDFLARNIAQLGLHVFRRVSETDRQRLREHGLARTIAQPNPYTTTYRLIESLVADFGIYHNAYWLKLAAPGGGVALLRVPPEMVEIKGGLGPTLYTINLGAKIIKVQPEGMVHFRGYNPESSIQGLSPLETLRRVLAEEFASGDYREYFWRNAARMSLIIERPAEAPEWSDAARARFTAEFEAMYAGGSNSGKTVVLEEGMTAKPTTFDAQQSEYLGGRKLTREEVARSYHIPLTMVGILDHATFTNIKDQHKQLYVDCLGPINAMIEQEIELQLLPEFGDTEGVYVEFNIAEKLQGSFEEQAQSFSTMVGRPIMTADEARARINLPSRGGDADELATPLNVLIGGQANPRDAAPDNPPKALPPVRFKADGEVEIDPTLPQVRERHVAKWTQVLVAFFRRQQAAVIGRVREGAEMGTVWNDGERWDEELSADLLRLNTATATVWAKYVADLLETELDAERMDDYLRAVAANSAGRINATTRDQIAAALLDEAPKEAVKGIFEHARQVRAEGIARSGVTGSANFGSHEGARQGGLKTKAWQVNSANPREAHAALNGETVGIGDRFSNGMRWPGDPVGGPENNANCHCSLRYGR